MIFKGNIVKIRTSTIKKKGEWAKSVGSVAKLDETLSTIDNDPTVFNKSTRELIDTDENYEIEFKETFSLPVNFDQNNEVIKREGLSISNIRSIAIKEICGF